MKTAKRKHRHKFMTADTHACVFGLILLLVLCRYLGEDITGILFFSIIFTYPILRCLWDWIFVIYAVVSAAAKYIFERSCYHVSKFKRQIRNGNIDCN